VGLKRPFTVLKAENPNASMDQQRESVLFRVPARRRTTGRG
jgi:hypothetical protein